MSSPHFARGSFAIKGIQGKGRKTQDERRKTMSPRTALRLSGACTAAGRRNLAMENVESMETLRTATHRFAIVWLQSCVLGLASYVLATFRPR